jgi:murein DD-endopeptidase MepM/ murein hydrolase activator NlpD
MPFQRLESRRSSRRVRVQPLQIILALSVLLNLWLFVTWEPKDEAEGSEVDPSAGADQTVATATEVSVQGGASPSDVSSAEVVEVAVEGGTAELETDPSPAPAPLDIPALFVRVTIDGPISRGFVKQLGSPLGDRLALTMTRLLVWNMQLKKDPRPGDIVDLLYELNAEGQARILGLRYQSEKYGKDLTAWSYKPSGWKFGSWFDSAGREVPGRLEGSPMDQFEEITSLLGDGRGHSGMDFKAPVGTPITAPFDGTVTRSNWRWKYNGNCLEIKSARGTTARFLHLSGLADGITEGARVRKGQKIALSGNTGRSSAPHLHYELSAPSGKTLDPLRFHDVSHTALGTADAAGFEQRKAELLGWMDKGIAHRAQ